MRQANELAADVFAPPFFPDGPECVAALSVNTGVFHRVETVAARPFLIFTPASIFVTNGEFE